MVKEFNKYEEHELPKCKKCKQITGALVGDEKICLECAMEERSSAK
jgi:hypothetical protein